MYQKPTQHYKNLKKQAQKETDQWLPGDGSGRGKGETREKGAVFGSHLSASQCFMSHDKRGRDDPLFCQQLIPAKVLIAH